MVISQVMIDTNVSSHTVNDMFKDKDNNEEIPQQYICTKVGNRLYLFIYLKYKDSIFIIGICIHRGSSFYFVNV